MFKSSSLRLRVAFVSLAALLLATPASAHHAMEGRVPANAFEGFMTGLAHPVIGIDHLAFVVAVGLLALTKRQGIWVPISFVIAALGGTAVHLMGVDLFASEFFTATSVLAFGILLALPKAPHVAVMIALGAIAGIFHGYAYGEAIVGAETMPLVSYLAGFTAIQIGITLLAFKLGKAAVQLVDRTPVSLRFAGFTICGLGAAFMVSRLGL